MASAFSHAVAALALGTAFWRPEWPKRVWAAAALCSALPDLDVIAFAFGIPYRHMLGHRGLSHSLCMAGVVAVAALWLIAPRETPHRGRLWTYLFLATASHGLLDAFTNGGLGVAFLAPFDNHRFFFPWTPIQVSPIGVGRFFSARGLAVLRSELLWIWLPSLVFATGMLFVRRPKEMV